jgi:hypothetical protein
MYRQLGLRATVLGASASGAAGVAGAAPDLPAIVRLLLLFMTFSMALYLAISFVLVALTLIFRLTARDRPISRAPARPTATARGEHRDP